MVGDRLGQQEIAPQNVQYHASWEGTISGGLEIHTVYRVVLGDRRGDGGGECHLAGADAVGLPQRFGPEVELVCLELEVGGYLGFISGGPKYNLSLRGERAVFDLAPPCRGEGQTLFPTGRVRKEPRHREKHHSQSPRHPHGSLPWHTVQWN